MQRWLEIMGTGVSDHLRHLNALDALVKMNECEFTIDTSQILTSKIVLYQNNRFHMPVYFVLLVYFFIRFALARCVKKLTVSDRRKIFHFKCQMLS